MVKDSQKFFQLMLIWYFFLIVFVDLWFASYFTFLAPISWLVRTSEKKSTFDPTLYMVHKMAGGGGLAQQVAEKLADLIQVSF